MTANNKAPRLQVRTASSTYLIDLEESWVSRQPGDEATSLRQDAERIPLAGLLHPVRLGQPMHLVLTGLAGPNVLTLRSTTPVVEIAPVQRGS